MKKILTTLIILVFIVAAGVGVYFIVQQTTKEKELIVQTTVGGYVDMKIGNVSYTISEEDSITRNVDRDTKIELTATPISGYEFTGWSVDGGIIDENPYIFEISDDITLRATFDLQDYQLTIVGSDGSTVSTIDYNNNQNLLETLQAGMTAPDDGYEYVFKIDGQIVTAQTTISANTEVNYEVLPIEYTVTFMHNGEQVGETQTYTVKDKTITPPAVPTEDGYKIAWEAYDLDVLGNKVVNTTKTLIEYTVTFMYNGNIIGTDTYTVEDKNITEPTVPTAEVPAGYELAWETYDLNVLGNKEVNAVVTPIQYIARFIHNGHVIGEVPYTVEDDTITPPALPNVPGYIVTWQDYTLEIGGITVETSLTVEEYTVTFMHNGSQVGEVQKYTIENKTVTEPSLEGLDVADGYQLAWEEYDLNDLANITVNTVATPIPYTVTFMHNGEQVGEVQTYTVENKSITEPQVPNSDEAGYTLEWADYDLNVLGNKVVNTVKVIINYTVTVDLNGATGLGSIASIPNYNSDTNTFTYTVEDGNITLPTDVTKTNYAFICWIDTTDGSETNIASISTDRCQDITIKAVWGINLVVNPTGDSFVPDQDQEYFGSRTQLMIELNEDNTVKCVYRVGSSIEYVGTLSEFVTKLNLMDAMNDITDVNGTTVSSEEDVANAINSEVAKAISSSSTQVNLTLVFGEN